MRCAFLLLIVHESGDAMMDFLNGPGFWGWMLLFI
jgi:hypothetical protein